MNKHCTVNPKHNAMTIAKYRPASAFIHPFGDLVNELINRDISQFLGHDDVRQNSPAVNIMERAHAFELQLLAPGFNKEDLKLDMENKQLTIRGERKKEELEEGERWTRREFNTRSFSRSFSLPETVNVEGIKAEFSNGVLHVHLPKVEVSKPKTREINIG